eukprot:NODE_607_length_5446_cov_0.832055.p4 type:complete len:248 gc:universal NODE_607_length_5446_cov_0.832055:1288-2031(+)
MTPQNLMKSIHLKPGTMKAVLRKFADNSPLSLIDVPTKIFCLPPRRDVVWSCLEWQRSLMRQGTASVKGRGEVKGSGRKMRPQKKSGRARAGNKRVPHWKGGSVAFGPKPRSYAQRLPLKIRELGLKVLLSDKLNNDELRFIDGFEPKLVGNVLRQHYTPITKDAALGALKNNGNYASALLITGEDSEISLHPELPSNGKLARICNTLRNVKSLHVKNINIADVLDHHYIIMDTLAREKLEHRLSSK